MLAAAALPAGRAATAHDLYLAVQLGGAGQVMGRRAPLQSGIYRSADRRLFEHVGPNHIWIYALAPDPHDKERMFVAAMDGVMRTPDRWQTWRIMTGWEITEPKAIACDPNARGHVYAGLPDGFAVSEDAGQTWQRRHTGIRRPYTAALAVDRTEAGRVVAGTEQGIYLTGDGGRTWQIVQSTRETVYDVRQSPHAPEVFLAVTARDGAWRSEDGARTWQRLMGVPTGQTLHNADFDPHDARRLVVCGWGAGVLVSEDGGATWSDRTAGLPKREIWRVAADADVPGRLYAAPYLAPLFASDDFGRTWRPVMFEQAIVLDMRFVPKP